MFMRTNISATAMCTSLFQVVAVDHVSSCDWIHLRIRTMTSIVEDPYVRSIISRFLDLIIRSVYR